jgi:hypothetical protein
LTLEKTSSTVRDLWRREQGRLASPTRPIGGRQSVKARQTDSRYGVHLLLSNATLHLVRGAFAWLRWLVRWASNIVVGVAPTPINPSMTSVGIGESAWSQELADVSEREDQQGASGRGWHRRRRIGAGTNSSTAQVLPRWCRSVATLTGLVRRSTWP